MMRSGPVMVQHLYEEVRLSFFQSPKTLAVSGQNLCCWFILLCFCHKFADVIKSFDPSIFASKLILHFCGDCWFRIHCRKGLYGAWIKQKLKRTLKRGPLISVSNFIFIHIWSKTNSVKVGGILSTDYMIERVNLAHLSLHSTEWVTLWTAKWCLFQVLNVAGALIMIQPTCQQAPSSWNLAGTSQQIPRLNLDDRNPKLEDLFFLYCFSDLHSLKKKIIYIPIQE